MSFSYGAGGGPGLTEKQLQRINDVGTYGFWADNAHTSGSPQSITGGARTQFTVNALGATTDVRYLADADSGVFASSVIVPNAVGDAFLLRMGLTVVPSSVSQGEYVEVQLDIGDVSEINIVTDRIELTKGIGVTHVKTLSFPIFCLDTFVANGGRIYLTPSIDITVYDKTIFLQRTYLP